MGVRDCRLENVECRLRGDEFAIAMRILRDFERRAVRLTDERRQHILGRPEMAGLESSVEETLRSPQTVIQSLSDPAAQLYYRYYNSFDAVD